MKCLFLLSCGMAWGLWILRALTFRSVGEHTFAGQQIWSRPWTWAGRICSPALLWAGPSHIPACGAMAVLRHCSSGNHGSAQEQELFQRCFISLVWLQTVFNLSFSAKLTLWEVSLSTSTIAFSHNSLLHMPKKGVISFTANLASNETLNCGTRALWW